MKGGLGARLLDLASSVVTMVLWKAERKVGECSEHPKLVSK
jgi:hypothetical protein